MKTRCLALASVVGLAVALAGCDLEGSMGDLSEDGGGDAGAASPASSDGGSPGRFDGGVPNDAGADAGAVRDGGSDGGDGVAPRDAGSPDASVVGNPRLVLLCDEGNQRILLVDLKSPGSAVWRTPLDGMRDIQLVGGGRVAASITQGYVELDLETGEKKKEVRGFAGVETLRRLPNGHTVLGANTNGGVTLQELDEQDAPVAGRLVTFPGYSQLRLLRRTPQGTFLLGVGTKLAEVDWTGRRVWEMDIPDGSSVYQGLRLADQSIAVASGYGAAILIIDPTTKKVRKTIGGKAQPEASQVVPNFFAGFQVLPNGHFVVTNWEGHGGGNGGKGLQLLEYDSAGALVWKWKQDPNLVSSLHGVIVLDGLDTAKVHDDVNGALAPVTQ
jgi:hypothetical protein